VITSLAVDSTGQFLLMGIDVAGIYRSSDGGRHWQLATVGYWPRGCAAVAIDPKNPKYCVAVGANSAPGTWHGIWLSDNGAASWRASSLKANIAGHQDAREQLAFDPTSFDGNRTRRLYWSRARVDHANWGTPEIHPAIYRSEETWQELANSEPAAGGRIRTSADGTVWASGPEGLYSSSDRGANWRQVWKGTVEGFDLSPERPRALWLNTPRELLFSPDRGETWNPLPVSGLVEDGYVLKNVHVSPVDAQNIVLWRDQVPNQWDWRRCASSDGGRTWTQSTFDNTGAFLPYNNRGGVFLWSPRDPKRLHSTGADWPTISRDGGRTFAYSGAGENAVLVGGMWSFCPNDPDTMAFGSQDYNGAITRDRGRTWTYLNPSGNGWGGFVYAGLAVTPSFLIMGNADSWGGKRMLRVSQDGGKSWRDTGVELNGPDVSFPPAGHPRVAFAKDHRTQDGGKTWAKMQGCEGVFASGRGRDLYGVAGKAVVKSGDLGRIWTQVADAPDEVRDLAYDGKRGRLYAVLGDRAFRWTGSAWWELDIPKNQFGGSSARSIAVDPQKPEVVYVGSAGNLYSTTVALVRSEDAGRTWTNLTRTAPLGPGVLDGGREVTCVRVHPRTREAWVSTSCYGLWKVSPPAGQVGYLRESSTLYGPTPTIESITAPRPETTLRASKSIVSPLAASNSARLVETEFVAVNTWLPGSTVNSRTLP
jgi:hypothetical protein